MTAERLVAVLALLLVTSTVACSSTPLFDRLPPDVQQGIKQECRDELEDRLGKGDIDVGDRRHCWEELARLISSQYGPTTTAP